MIDLCTLSGLVRSINAVDEAMRSKFNLSLNESVLLCAISKGLAGPGEISTSTGISPSLLSRHLRVMEKTGYITRKVDEQDRRKVRIELTTKGKNLVKNVHETDVELPPALAKAISATKGKN